MSSIKFQNTYDKILTDKQKDAMHVLYMKGINRDGHVWVTYGDVEDMVADMLSEALTQPTAKTIVKKSGGYSWSVVDGSK